MILTLHGVRSAFHLQAKRLIMGNIFTDESTAHPAEGSISALFHSIEPLTDCRWDKFLKKHPRASVFHSTQWLEALRRTYGYEPVVYTTSSGSEELRDGIVFCRVESWLTGRRLVSLPFSDHCEPLVDSTAKLHDLTGALQRILQDQRWRYIEIRPIESVGMMSPLWHSAATYRLHQLDLRPSLDTIFRNFHKGSIQRKILRAEREGLIYREGRNDALLDAFYRLLILTRRRHQVPPQPRKWFRNLVDCFGEALKIRIAFKNQIPVAGMVTLRYKDTLVYKYGGSDNQFHNLGGMHLLYWGAIREAKSAGLRVFDLGRSDADQMGLITFKTRWGASSSRLTYSRCAGTKNPAHLFDPRGASSKLRVAKRLISVAPAEVLSALGDLLYKHIG